MKLRAEAAVISYVSLSDSILHCAIFTFLGLVEGGSPSMWLLLNMVCFCFYLTIFCLSWNVLHLGSQEYTRNLKSISWNSHSMVIVWCSLFWVVSLRVYSKPGLCHAVLDSLQAGLRVELVSISLPLFGRLSLQDHQTVQHKSDWQCITAAMCFSFTQRY